MFLPLCAHSQNTLEVDGYDDESLRVNPQFETSHSTEGVEVSKYPFLNLEANNVQLNGSDFSLVKQRVQNGEMLRVLHIGDSHVQADMATSCIRSMLQDRYGSAGRGLVVPLKLAGTNQPYDYAITSNSSFAVEKLFGKGASGTDSFSGFALVAEHEKFAFSITSQEAFERVFVYYGGHTPRVVKITSGGAPLFHSVSYMDDCVCIDLPLPCENVDVEFESDPCSKIHAFELISDSEGVVYNTIGINGASFDTFGKIGGFAQSVSLLEPDLVIVSLGTNDAFGRFSSDEFERSVDMFFQPLVTACPNAAILIATPSECQRRKGARRRGSYITNKNVQEVRTALVKFARKNGMALYDWFEVAGGDGASKHWLSHALLGRDRVHLTAKGYSLQGHLFGNALIKVLEE